MNFKHGQSDTKIYAMWQSMIGRCKYPSHTSWKWYGAIGVRVCDRWKNFESFVKDMGPRPEGATIERKNPSGDYCPENCKWATRKEQANNKRNSVRLHFNGKSQSMNDWSSETGLGYDLISDRRHKGWTDERILATPIQSLKMLTFGGKTQSVKAWARETGIKYGTLWFRLKMGIRPEIALVPTRYFSRTTK